MLKAIEAYLALRRATGFAMLNAECLLKSFAAYARGQGLPLGELSQKRFESAEARDTAVRDFFRIQGVELVVGLPTTTIVPCMKGWILQ